MNDLNVFNQTYCPWRYPSNWRGNIRLFFRQFKWAWQRVTKGYCDADTYDLDDHLVRYLAQTIQHLADNTHGYPGTDEFPTYEHWKSYLYKIVGLLNYSLDELYNPYEYEWEQSWKDKDFLETINNPTPEEKEISDKFHAVEWDNETKKREARDEALQMILHVIDSLWD